MKDFYTHELPLAELARNPERVLGPDASQSTLHYCSPAHGGWGVVKVALLVPEVYLLFVCPAACGRHGAIAAIEQGYRNRLGYLCINDNEIVLGGYEAEIEKGVRELLDRVKPRPRALMIFVSCIDDLLGTDHTAALMRMEAEHGIPIKLARMNPISMVGKMPPGIRVQKSMYEFLEPPVKKDRGIILLGAYRPPAQNSELAKLFNHYGFGPIRHPEYCPDFDSFKEMAQSAAAVLVRPEGRAAGEDLSSRLGIPVFRSFMAYEEGTVTERYQGLITFLESLDDRNGTSLRGERGEPYFRAARETLAERGREARALLGDARIAIDSTVTIAPFNLALALVKSGLNLSRIYTTQLPEFEKPSLAELAKLKGDILVSNPVHVRKYGPRQDGALTEIAMGFEAGYSTAAPITVPLAFDEQMYGFEGYTRVLERLMSAFQMGASDLRQQVRDYGLVV
ncbi:MAG: nitrogenase component 1 [Treponema sp.]|jgi:hypothetical protein|nr:nitrogenase component 1 [Treponema sp.]